MGLFQGHEQNDSGGDKKGQEKKQPFETKLPPEFGFLFGWLGVFNRVQRAFEPIFYTHPVSS
jgi:hypothetical protein